MSARALLARAERAGFHFTLLPDNRVHVRPTPPDALLAEVRAARDAIAAILAAQADPAMPTQKAQRKTRPGVLPSDPPAPVVDPEASITLVILELAGAGPRLAADGRLRLAHPQRVTPEERDMARRHQADIAALLAYRALIEQHRPAG